MVKYPNFLRTELQSIREKAIDMAKTEGLNPGWKRLYYNLADSADHLDAAMARCEVKTEEAQKVPQF